MTMDTVRISKTIAFLLRHRPDVGGLTPDADGWVQVEDLAAALTRLLRDPVDAATVTSIVTAAQVQRFELQDTAIRATTRPLRSGQGPRRQPRVQPPDILYHATTEGELRRITEQGLLAAGRDKFVYLSDDEAHAWRVAHRLPEGPARVLFVDATRARRHGVQFFRNKKNGLYFSTPVSTRDILNLQDGFAEQHSAGGFPIRRGPDGKPQVALIQVTRRSGTTWEVAKGKLEPGETPEATAIREVQEEMGIETDLRITRYLDTVRYGFMAPGGLPRLKSVFLYLMEPSEPVTDLTPRTAEGIGDVGWFSIDEAVRVVTHSSLQPVMRRLHDLLAREAYAMP
jgi:putative RNA 2'-phosphotransferase